MAEVLDKKVDALAWHVLLGLAIGWGFALAALWLTSRAKRRVERMVHSRLDILDGPEIAAAADQFVRKHRRVE